MHDQIKYILYIAIHLSIMFNIKDRTNQIQMAIYNRKTPVKCDCPMEKALNVISGKWKLAILCELNRGKSRLKDLVVLNPEASKRALSQQLGELVHDGILQKKDFEVFPKKVEYALTQSGHDLIPVLDLLNEFGKKL